MKDKQARVENAFSFERRRPDVINGLVDTGVGIEVGTKLHANGLAPWHNTKFLAFPGKVFCSVECHMLQEVRKATLTRFLQDGAYPLGNIEICQARFLVIVPDVIGESVLERAFSHL